MRRFGAAVLVGVIAAAGASPVRADAIDGHWCFTDGKRISIQGPSVVTPAGSHIEGDYTRHFFRYVAPQADPDAGQTVSMTLLNEDTMRVGIGADAAGEIWHRCGPPTS